MANFEPDEVMDFSSSPERAKEYGLYVNNIPQELNQDGLKQLFENYGDVTAILHPHNSKWAFVTYGTYQEAERAIKALHDTSPLYLKIQLKKEEGKKMLPESMLRSNDVRYTNKSFVQTVGRGRPLNSASRVPGIVPECSYTPENDLLYSVPVDAYTYNPYDPPDPYSDTNTLWTRGVKTITADGKRHISLGRGYTLYEIPYAPVGFDDSLRTVYAQRSGLYVNGNNQIGNRIGHCKRCSTITKMRCERCQEFYCSRDCQVSDWPLHKTECQEIPGLIDAMDSTLLTQTDTKNRESHENSVSQPTLRRPKLPSQEDQTKYSDVPLPGVQSSEKPTPVLSELQVVKTDTKLKVNQELTDECNIRQRSPMSKLDLIKQQCKTPIGSASENTQKQASCLNDAQNTYNSDASQSSHSSSNTKQMTCQNAIHNKSNGVKMGCAKSERDKNGYSSNYDQNNDKQDNVQLTSRRHILHKNDSSNDQLINRIENNDAHKDTAQHSQSEVLKNEDILKKFNQMDEDIAFRKDTFLAKTKFTEVEIIVKEDNNEYWVQKIEDRQMLTNMMIQIQEIASRGNVTEPKIGTMFAVQYEDVWHRAIITSLKPLRAHFIDYGNAEIVTPKDIRDLPTFQEVDPYARKIRISGDCSDKLHNFNVGDTVNVKTSYVDRGKVIVVDLQRENDIGKGNTDSTVNSINTHTRTNVIAERQGQTHQPSGAAKMNEIGDGTSAKVKSIVELLSNKQKGLMQVNTQFSSNSYGVTILSGDLESEFKKILMNLPDECKNLIPEPNFKPRVGDLICGQRVIHDDWIRGYVLSVNSQLQIAVIDEARTAAVQNAMPCPPNFSKICAFSAVFQRTDCDRKLEPGMSFNFEVLNTEDIVEIQIENNAKTMSGKGIVKEWKPLSEQKGIQYAELKNEAEVCITAYKNQHILYARPVERGNVESYIKLSQSVAKHAVSAKNLEAPPVIGQMVMAQYSDMNYYRAIVVKVDGTKAGISYVDFGNLGYSEWKKFKELPDDLKQIRSCTAKITLKDVPTEVPMTKEVNEFLESLVVMETPLTCVFDGEPFKDGVQLKLKNGENLNEKLKKMLTPSHLKEPSKEEENTCYMVSDLETAELGDVGAVKKVLILCKMPGENHRYVMCPLDQQLITHVMEVMPPKISDYCKNAEMYIPRDNELCLVLFEEGWYRAVCLCRNQTPSTALVFFVDYGNIESAAHDNIRKMTKDFMSPSALGSICTVVNSFPRNGEDYPSKIKDEISTLLAPNNAIEVKIIQAEGDGHYDVQVPKLQDILQNAGLL